MSPETIQFEAFGRGRKEIERPEKKEPQVEAEKSISLAREAEEAFARDDFDTALEKLRELRRATTPEGAIESEYHEQLLKEFDRQVETLASKEYAEAAGIEQEELRKLFEPLKEHIRDIASREKETKEGHIPFIVVVKNEVLSGEKAMPLVELEGKKGYTYLDEDDVAGFEPFGVEVPDGKAYLAIDIETGKTTLGETPDEAIKKIKSEDRSSLTIEEGIALVTHHPEILKDNNIWMPGSRRGSFEVVLVWLVGGRPELHWSSSDDSDSEWGSASCGSRVGS